MRHMSAGECLDSPADAPLSRQVGPIAYARDLLVQLSGHSPPAAAALLPDVWLRAHPEARRGWSR